MKKLLLIPTLLIFLFSCEEENQMLKQLEEKRDSLNTKYKEISVEIAEIEAEIAKLDTTKKPFAVTADTIKLTSFSHYFDVQGKVMMEKNALLYPETAGNIIAVNVKEGQKVNGGQVIVQLDTDLIDKSIAEVETSYSLAKTVFEKQERLWKQNIGSEMQYLEAKANKESLENRLATLQRQLKMASVRAPFSGIVDKIMPNLGEMATPQMPVARIIDLDKVFIMADVSEDQLGKVTVGTPVEVLVAGKTYKSKVSRIGNYINPANRTFEVKVNIPNSGGLLKPNLVTRVTIEDYTKENTIALPSSIIQQTIEGNNFVYVLKKENGVLKVSKREIETGKSYLATTELLSGLSEGEVIVLKGGKSVQNGQVVSVSESK